MPLSNDPSARANQLANLRPAEPGECRNPGGMPGGTRHVQPGKWLAPLSECGDEELRAIVADPKASRSKKAAAQIWLDTSDEDPNVRRRALAELLDRTEGKSLNRTRDETERGDTPEQVWARAQKLAGGDGGPIGKIEPEAS